jgi:adenine-specific DNA-methyltransferase
LQCCNCDNAVLKAIEKNIQTIKELFPEVFTEGQIDFDVLKETLGDYIDDGQERYRFTWSGKALARRIAQASSTGTRKIRNNV